MAGVFVGLIVVKLTKINILDPITAILVSIPIMKTAVDLTRKSFGGLIDSRLPKPEHEQLVSYLRSHNGRAIDFHTLRTRKAGSWRFVDFNLIMPKDSNLSEVHQVCDHLEAGIKELLPNSSVTIHVEPCNTDCNRCHFTACDSRLSVGVGSMAAKSNF
jgi:divalent metal cation (Fe/Co/Zn/Cd) transporter